MSERAAQTPCVPLRAKILAEAIGIVYAEGPRQITMRSLAEKLGYSAATIYLHFKNKEELFKEIGLYGYDRLSATMEPSLAIEDPVEAVTDCARRYVDFALENYPLYRLMFTDFSPADRTPEEEARVLRLRDIVIELYRRGQESGVFHDRDLHLEGTIGWALVHGFVQLAAEGRLPPRPDGTPPDVSAMREAVIAARLAALLR